MSRPMCTCVGVATKVKFWSAPEVAVAESFGFNADYGDSLLNPQFEDYGASLQNPHLRTSAGITGTAYNLRDLIQRAALSHRHYGYRRIAHELRRGLR